MFYLFICSDFPIRVMAIASGPYGSDVSSKGRGNTLVVETFSDEVEKDHNPIFSLLSSCYF